MYSQTLLPLFHIHRLYQIVVDLPGEHFPDDPLERLHRQDDNRHLLELGVSKPPISPMFKSKTTIGSLYIFQFRVQCANVSNQAFVQIRCRSQIPLKPLILQSRDRLDRVAHMPSGDDPMQRVYPR